MNQLVFAWSQCHVRIFQMQSVKDHWILHFIGGETIFPWPVETGFAMICLQYQHEPKKDQKKG